MTPSFLSGTNNSPKRGGDADLDSLAAAAANGAKMEISTPPPSMIIQSSFGVARSRKEESIGAGGMRHLDNARYRRRITRHHRHRAFRAQLREYQSIPFLPPHQRPECIKLVLIILSTTARQTMDGSLGQKSTRRLVNPCTTSSLVRSPKKETTSPARHTSSMITHRVVGPWAGEHGR